MTSDGCALGEGGIDQLVRRRRRKKNKGEVVMRKEKVSPLGKWKLFSVASSLRKRGVVCLVSAGEKKK